MPKLLESEQKDFQPDDFKDIEYLPCLGVIVLFATALASIGFYTYSGEIVHHFIRAADVEMADTIRAGSRSK